MSQPKHLKTAEVRSTTPDKLGKKLRMKRMVGKAMLAGVALVPPIDYATSDAITIKAYPAADRVVQIDNRAADRIAHNGVLFTGIMASGMAVGLAASRSKKMQAAIEGYDEYVTEHREKLTGPRKAVSDVVHKPYDLLGSMGEWADDKRAKQEERKTKLGRTAGKLAYDAVVVNGMGTGYMAMSETMAEGKAPSVKRVAGMSALFAGTWTGAAELINQGRRFGPFDKVMEGAGWVFDKATTVDVSSLHDVFATPGNYTIGALAASVLIATQGSLSHAEKKLDLGLADELLPFPGAQQPEVPADYVPENVMRNLGY